LQRVALLLETLVGLRAAREARLHVRHLRRGLGTRLPLRFKRLQIALGTLGSVTLQASAVGGGGLALELELLGLLVLGALFNGQHRLELLDALLCRHAAGNLLRFKLLGLRQQHAFLIGNLGLARAALLVAASVLASQCGPVRAHLGNESIGAILGGLQLRLERRLLRGQRLLALLNQPRRVLLVAVVVRPPSVRRARNDALTARWRPAAGARDCRPFPSPTGTFPRAASLAPARPPASQLFFGISKNEAHLASERLFVPGLLNLLALPLHLRLERNLLRHGHLQPVLQLKLSRSLHALKLLSLSALLRLELLLQSLRRRALLPSPSVSPLANCGGRCTFSNC